MDIQVQSFLNSATKLPITINTSTTFADLKTLVWTAEGTTTTIQDFYIEGGVEIDTSATIVSYGLTTGSIVYSSNIINTLETREQRQVAKLELAKLRRSAAGDNTVPYYRERNQYDRDQLPTKYTGNTATDNPNPDGLILGRPWIE
jgi:hypothetical protein